MRVNVSKQRGMSLVETTIILLVLMLLTSVVAPSINDFVNDAKDVKVKEDCEAIGVTVMRQARDIGPCFKGVNVDPCSKINRVDVLYSDGEQIVHPDMFDGAAVTDFTSTEINQNLNWDLGPSAGDRMDAQFVLNLPGYTTPSDVASHNPLAGYQVPGPAFFLGWRGGYLNPHIGPDPWGLPYVVNSVFLSVATNATAGSGEGQLNGGWNSDTICISAGRDRTFSTPFGGNGTAGTARGGDDFVYVISGTTR